MTETTRWHWRENPDSWDEDELLSAAAGKDIYYFFSDALLFPWAELLSLISDRLQLREIV